jgi:hypothetical protein
VHTWASRNLIPFKRNFTNKLQINDEEEKTAIENENKKAFFSRWKIKSKGLFALPSSLKSFKEFFSIQDSQTLFLRN